MTISKRSIFLGAAIAACLSAVGFASEGADRVAHAFARITRAVADFSLAAWDLCTKIFTGPAQHRTPTAHAFGSLPLVVAKSYAEHRVRRMTPRIESTWRMCPSI